MHFQFRVMRPLADLIYRGRRVQSPARHIVRILYTNQRGLRVIINLRPNHLLNLLPGENPVEPARNPRHTARNRRHRRQLVQIHMTLFIANHLIAVMSPGLNRNQIAHASGRNKKRRFFPENLSCPLLQPVHRRVFPVHIIPNRSLGHSPPHLQRRPRNRIAPHPALSNRPSHRVCSSSSPCALCHVCKKRRSILTATHPRLSHQFHKHLVRNTQSSWSKPHHIPAPLHKSSCLQCFESLAESNPVLLLNPPHINPIQLSQPQKQLLFQSTLGRHRFHLLRGQPPGFYCSHIRRCIMRIRPPLRPRKRMRPRPESQIRLAPPILQIVLGL